MVPSFAFPAEAGGVVVPSPPNKATSWLLSRISQLLFKKFSMFRFLVFMDGIKLSYEEDALEYIVDKAVEFKLGARGLRSICESIMIDAMYEMPSQKIEEFKVTLSYAKEKMEKMNVNKLKAA